MKEIIFTSAAPEAIGPYSQAVRYNGIIYCSGQIPVRPDSLDVVSGDIEIQTKQVMKNIGEVLRAAGSEFSNILKCTIFLADMNDFSRMNEVYGSYFDEKPPARETVAVKSLPKNVLVEISCIAAE